jgi:peptidoglycan/xylan/chitin deacetylase (PgdA/CDA1 family)
VSAALWPDGARGALSLSFDNLGEAAEIELGALSPDGPLGDHFTVTHVLTSILSELMLRNLRATFFVEGLNAEIYPAPLLSAHLQNQELAYHAWRHEQWADLSLAEQADNLTRGLTAFRAHQLDFTGLRPPGGGLGPGGVEVLREAGLRYCSPAGKGVGVRDDVALLPFQWRHVDAACVLPPLAPVREGMTGSPDPLEPAAFVAFLGSEIAKLANDGGYMTIVLHPFMLDWLGTEQFSELLDRIAAARRSGDLWVATCETVAEHVLDNPELFHDGAALDPTSWGG